MNNYKPLRLAIFHAFAVFIGLVLAYNIWVQHAFQGKYWGTLGPGTTFGLMKIEKDIGMYAIDPLGWDTQFYYAASNDLLGTKDAPQHIDNPPYRYQRIFVPAFSRLVSILLGYNYTSPIIYNISQFFWMAVGFFVLIRWLNKNGFSQVYAYGWLFSFGVLNILAEAFPDPVGDAFFIMSMVFALEKRVVLYSLAASCLLLVREGYTVFAAIIFLMTFFNKLVWNNKSKWSALALTMLPGLLCIIWNRYITFHFGMSPMMSVKNANLTDWPFAGIIKSFLIALHTNNILEIKGKIIAVVTIFIAAYVAWVNRKVSVAWYAVLVYIILMFCLGTTVWMALAAYAKTLGTVIAAIIIGLPFSNKKVSVFLKFFLLLTAVYGLYFTYIQRNQTFYDKSTAMVTRSVNNVSNIIPGPLTSFASKIKPINVPKIIKVNSKSLFRFFYRTAMAVTVEVTNTSNITWPAYPEFGLYAINANYYWLNLHGKVLRTFQFRTPIVADIKPGESRVLNMHVLLPPPGTYLLRIEMIQEGVASFGDKNGGYYQQVVVVK